MKKFITNAKDMRLFDNPGTLPDMSSALLDWFQPMIFTQIVKVVENFVVTETPTDVSFQGVMQPFSDQQVRMKPEGQRTWKWYMLHAEPGLLLNPDDTTKYKGIQYRVLFKRDWKEYGYVEYHLVQDYSGSGPNT